MYDVDRDALLVVHDAHPEYASTFEALESRAAERRAVQHHRAHVASVLAEQHAWDTPVLGVAFDGTGYGDDGAIWGGELFVGCLRDGFERVANLRPALLPGGDAAARYPVQAAAGFLHRIDGIPDPCGAPFDFPGRYIDATQLLQRGVRTFRTTSVGRLFDTLAALLGFTRPITFEGQAAIWLEQLAWRGTGAGAAYDMPFEHGELDFRPLVAAVARDRVRGRPTEDIARGCHRAMADGLVTAAVQLCSAHELDTVVLSGGVFQNSLLLGEARTGLAKSGLRVWTNHKVPANDGGLSLGQAAVAILAPSGQG
jgi:hydrogenase maturation protein HypF